MLRPYKFGEYWVGPCKRQRWRRKVAATVGELAGFDRADIGGTPRDLRAVRLKRIPPLFHYYSTANRLGL